jgi:hypothetical protein
MIGWAIVACSSPPCGVEAAAGCTESTSTFPTSAVEDTAVELGDIRVRAKVEDCTGSDWYYTFDLSVTPADAELTISGVLADGARAEETHDLGIGGASHWQASVALVVVGGTSEPIPGVTTQFGCDRVDAMSWRLFTWDGSGRRSCLVWGAEPAMLEVDGCDRW